MQGNPKLTGQELVDQLLRCPDNWELRLAAANTLTDEGRLGEAMALLDAAPSPPGDESDLLQCAELYVRTQPAKAVQLLHAWLQVHPEAPVVHLAMADTALRLGDRNGAAAYYLRAIELQPEYRDPDLEIRYGLVAAPNPESALPAPEPTTPVPAPTPPLASLPRPAVVSAEPSAAVAPNRPRRRTAASRSPMALGVMIVTALGVFLTGWLIVALLLRAMLLG